MMKWLDKDKTVFFDIVYLSVVIDVKELEGQMSKCLKFCPGIEI